MKQLIIIVVVFVIGLAIGSSKSFKAGQEKANANLSEATQSATICKEGVSIDKMKALRDVDNRGFVIAANSMAACGKIITAIGKGDSNAVDAQTAFVIDAKRDMDKVNADRTKLLKDAGIPNE